MSEIINRVAQSGLLTIDLEKYIPTQDVVAYDLKDNLVQSLFLKEKNFRTFVKNHDWSQYTGKVIALHCSAEAIVPVWAYMLLASKFNEYAHQVIFGTKQEVLGSLWRESLQQKIDLDEFREQRVIIKGCGQIPIPEVAYVEATQLLIPVVRSLMYGEACSSVPLFKRKKEA